MPTQSTRPTRRQQARLFRRALRVARALTTSGLAAIIAACGVASATPQTGRPEVQNAYPGQIIGYRANGAPIRLQFGGAGPALVQSKSGITSGSPGVALTITLTSATTAGNCLIVTIATDGTAGNGHTASITLGGAAGNFHADVTANGNDNVDIWSDWNCAGGQTSVVITSAGGTSTQYLTAWVQEWSGLVNTASPFDKSSTAIPGSNSLSWSSGATATLSQASEVAVGLAIMAPTITGPSSPWTNLAQLTDGTGSHMITGYQVVSATTGLAYAGTVSPTTVQTSAIATYKAAPLPLSPIPPQRRPLQQRPTAPLQRGFARSGRGAPRVFIPTTPSPIQPLRKPIRQTTYVRPGWARSGKGAPFVFAPLPPPLAFNNYLQLGQVTEATLPPFQYATPNSGGPWTAAPTGTSIYVNVYDQTPSGQPIHLVEDAGARLTTIVEGPGTGQLLGVVEATAPVGPLNANPYFTAAVTPWTATGGTITQSSAQTHGGNPFSGLLTPSGSAAQAVAKSETFVVSPDTDYTLDGWFYSPPGWSSVTLGVAWRDSGGNPVNSPGFTVSVPAATWTHITGTLTAPAAAAQAAIAVTESGTPPGTALLYLSAVLMDAAWLGLVTSIAQIGYDPTTGQPVSVTALG